MKIKVFLFWCVLVANSSLLPASFSYKCIETEGFIRHTYSYKDAFESILPAPNSASGEHKTANIWR